MKKYIKFHCIESNRGIIDCFCHAFKRLRTGATGQFSRFHKAKRSNGDCTDGRECSGKN